jgi:ATP-binding protein involved in chromosome partitioning
MSRNLPPDFREGMIAKRLRDVRMIFLVLSGKGGVGKSVVSATLAALFAKTGLGVGLLDADIYGPSSALLFGTRTRPKEGKAGLIPTVVSGVRIMSVDLFAPGRVVPLTGVGAREVVREMLALTHWGPLDYLIIDMPPATADITMLFTSLRRKNLGAFVVTTPDKLSLAVARRVLQLLDSGRVPVVGVFGNMHRTHRGRGARDDDGPRRLAEEFDTRFLGKLPFDTKLAAAADGGSIEGLLHTKFAETLSRSVESYLEPSVR